MKIRSLKYYFFIVNFLLFKCTTAQNYQAINGSVYAGSLSPGNNPASIVHVPFAWDITPLAVQAKQSSNAYTINNFSLLSSPRNTTINAENGIKNRFVFANQNIRLLNTRIKLDAKSAIAFGANIRSYMFASSGLSNYQDTAYSLADYLKINLDYQPLSFETRGNAWTELYATYARTIMDDGYSLVNGGVTIKFNRSVAGGYGNGEGIRYVPSVGTDNVLGYLLTNGSLQYGYSSNFDLIDSNKTAIENGKAFLKNAYSSVSADIGVEYILLSKNEEDEEADDYTYDTKIGVSIMDIGSNRYRYSNRSRFATAGKQGITDTLLENKFREVKSLDDFNDSLASIANSIQGINGDFVIYQPTRLVINLDKRLTNNFFVNAELTLPIISLATKNTLFIKDINLLALTPRWETKSLGAYLPVLMNTRKQLWVGGAFRAGPLLLGTHNIANLFSKNSVQNGGFYLALTVRPGRSYSRQKDDHQLSKKERRHLNCPAF